MCFNSVVLVIADTTSILKLVFPTVYCFYLDGYVGGCAAVAIIAITTYLFFYLLIYLFIYYFSAALTVILIFVVVVALLLLLLLLGSSLPFVCVWLLMLLI